MANAEDPVARPLRWVEPDPWVGSIACAEDTWLSKVIQHPEIESHEEAVRQTLRDPDALFLDPDSTARRQRPSPEREIWIVHYIGMGRCHGPQEGNFVRIVVRWERDRITGATRGYVHTILLPDSIEPRLQLIWERIV